MKARKYVLANQAVKRNFLVDLHALPIDGSITVTLSSTGSKSARQRGLQHIWYDDIVMSGLGGEHESSPEGLDIYCKYRWGIRILTADDIGPNEDSYLAENFSEYSKKYHADPNKMVWWVTQNIHTEDMNTNQMAQFLTEIQRYYAIVVGVNLTDPDEKGWESLLKIAEEKAA